MENPGCQGSCKKYRQDQPPSRKCSLFLSQLRGRHSPWPSHSSPKSAQGCAFVTVWRTHAQYGRPVSRFPFIRIPHLHQETRIPAYRAHCGPGNENSPRPLDKVRGQDTYSSVFIPQRSQVHRRIRRNVKGKKRNVLATSNRHIGPPPRSRPVCTFSVQQRTVQITSRSHLFPDPKGCQ